MPARDAVAGQVEIQNYSSHA